MLTKQFAGQAAQVYTYLSGTHRLGSVDGISRSYDSNGNTTSRSDGTTLAYSDQNRLYAAAVPANWTEYGYSGRGERVRKLQDNAGTPIADRYTYNESGQMLHNRKNEVVSGTPVETQTDYLFIDSIPVAQTREKTLNYIEADHLGTPRVSANSATNAKEWSWDLLGKAFGENAATTAAGGNDVQLRYPGQWVDGETGLHYNFYRDYDPSTGRYIESDPIGLIGGLKTYGYGAANPIMQSDYFGLFPDSLTNACISQPELCILAGGAAIGAAITLPMPGATLDTDASSAICPANQPCDPPAGTRCISKDIGHDHKGRGDPHWHTYQMNQLPNGSCIWNKMRALGNTYGLDAPPPEELRPCESYPSWTLAHD